MLRRRGRRASSLDPAGLAAVNGVYPANGGANPQTWNACAYVGDAPLEAIDPSRLCGAVIAGSGESAGTPATAQETKFADAIGAQLAFPFAGLSDMQSYASVEAAANGVDNQSVQTASAAIAAAAAQSPGNFTVYVFSGGAQAALSAMGGHARFGDLTRARGRNLAGFWRKPLRTADARRGPHSLGRRDTRPSRTRAR